MAGAQRTVSQPGSRADSQVQRRKRERWVRILASEAPGRAPGRRPRDPAKEKLLLRLDRARLARRLLA